MLNGMNGVLSGLEKFLRIGVYPLITPLFVIINYVKLRDLVKGESPWAKIFLVVSVIYLLLTFGFGVYGIIKNVKEGISPH